jgi:hypothetical protein
MEPARAKAHAQLHMEVINTLPSKNSGRCATRKRRRRKATLRRYERRLERIITLHAPVMQASCASKYGYFQRALHANRNHGDGVSILIGRVGDWKALLNEFPCYCLLLLTQCHRLWAFFFFQAYYDDTKHAMTASFFLS